MHWKTLWTRSLPHDYFMTRVCSVGVEIAQRSTYNANKKFVNTIGTQFTSDTALFGLLHSDDMLGRFVPEGCYKTYPMWDGIIALTHEDGATALYYGPPWKRFDCCQGYSYFSDGRGRFCGVFRDWLHEWHGPDKKRSYLLKTGDALRRIGTACGTCRGYAVLELCELRRAILYVGQGMYEAIPGKGSCKAHGKLVYRLDDNVLTCMELQDTLFDLCARKVRALKPSLTALPSDVRERL